MQHGTRALQPSKEPWQRSTRALHHLRKTLQHAEQAFHPARRPFPLQPEPPQSHQPPLRIKNRGHPPRPTALMDRGACFVSAENRSVSRRNLKNTRTHGHPWRLGTGRTTANGLPLFSPRGSQNLMACSNGATASWSAVAKMQGASLCIDDTAVERGKNGLRPENAVRHTTAVSRQGLPHALHDAGARICGATFSSRQEPAGPREPFKDGSRWPARQGR